MKSTYTFLFLLFLVSLSFSQTKYMVYFKDKGTEANIVLKKSSALQEFASKELTPRAIERRKKVMGENYFTYDDMPLNKNYVDQIESRGIKIANKLKWLNAVSCYLSDKQLNEIKNLPFIQKIETVKTLVSSYPIEQNIVPEAKKQSLKKTTSLDYGESLSQNNLSDIPAVHDLGINGDGVVVGILDSGFRWKTLPSLSTKNVLAEHDFVFNDNVTANESQDIPSQDNHGTAVFSIMAGYAPGFLIGPAYGASFILAKTENVPSETHAEEDNYAAALEWMDSIGVDITSSSLGYSLFDNSTFSYSYNDMNGNTTIVAKAANAAFERGISTFTAAGNDGNNSWYYISSPGDAFNILTVGAVTNQNILASYSSHGPTSDGRIKPEIVTMGSSVQHAVAGTTTYQKGNGTSYATPIAAGIAALLKSTYPFLTNRQIRDIFIACGDNTDNPNNDRGYGLISAKRLICYPNINNVGSQFILNKIFMPAQDVDATTVNIFYKTGSGNYQNSFMSFDGNYKYTFTLPQIHEGEQLKFYFTYTTTTGSIIREPEGDKIYSLDLSNDKIITDVKNNFEIPKNYSLAQNYPNPFNPATVINYSVPAAANVKLKIYDVLGNEIASLVNEYKQPGNYSIQFSANKYGLSSGVYFYTLNADNFTQTRKMIYLK